MFCSECGLEGPAHKTVYWPEDGDEGEEWPLCDRCYEGVAGEVVIVPGPYPVWGWCNACKGWHSLRDMSRWSGGGPHDAPQGTCRACDNGARR